MNGTGLEDLGSMIKTIIFLDNAGEHNGCCWCCRTLAHRSNLQMSLFDRRVCHDPQSLNGYCRPSVVPTFVASTAIYIYESPYIYTYKYPHGGFLSHGVYLQNHPFKNRIVHRKNHPAIGGIPIYEKPHILHIIPSPQYKKPSENHILVGGLNTYLGP